MPHSCAKQLLIDELQAIILQTMALIDRFEQKKMQEVLPVDYAQLYDILKKSTQQQRELQQQLILEKQTLKNPNADSAPSK